jgi:hypothetical protein
MVRFIHISSSSPNADRFYPTALRTSYDMDRKQRCSSFSFLSKLTIPPPPIAFCVIAFGRKIFRFVFLSSFRALLSHLSILTPLTDHSLLQHSCHPSFTQPGVGGEAVVPCWRSGDPLVRLFLFYPD